MKKVIKKTISMFLSIFVVLLVFLNVMSIATRGNNYGAPKFFGYTVLNVATDSMEPTLKVGTLVFAKDVEPSELVPQEVDDGGNIVVEGDIITFFRQSDNKIVTHRLLKKTLNADGRTYTLECFGDNLTSGQCTNHDCSTYPHDIINSDYLIGKVVASSYGLGKIYGVVSDRLVSFLLIFIPGGYVLISAVVDFITQAKLLKEAESDERKRLEEGGLTKEQELEKLKNEYKEKLRKEQKEEK